MSTDRFGLIYARTYTGSMVGSGLHVFAVWGYVVANGFGGSVDLNPKSLAAILGGSEELVRSAIAYLCAPDPESRSDEDEGRRLRHLRGHTYEIINYPTYAHRGRSAELKQYHRERQQRLRERKRAELEEPVAIRRTATASEHCDSSCAVAAAPDLDLNPDRARDRVTLDPERRVLGERPGDHEPPPPVSERVARASAGQDATPIELARVRERIDAGNVSDWAQTRGFRAGLEAIGGPPPLNVNPTKLQANDVIDGGGHAPPDVLHELPDDLGPILVALHARAIETGVPTAYVDQRLEDLRKGPIGGKRGVLRKRLQPYLLDLVTRWRNEHETDRAKARGGPGLVKTRGSAALPEGDPWGPLDSRHRELAERLGVKDLDSLVSEYRRTAMPRDKSSSEIDRHFASWLKRRTREVA